MPLKFFSCPDGIRVEIKDCLNHCRRPEGRCLALPYLALVGRTREWKGRPSTTQLLNGTRLAYLEITKDYAVNPAKKSFMALGTRHHKRLEKVADKLNVLVEEEIDEEITGIFDLLAEDELEEKEAYELWDYKTSGSYKVAKALGLVPKKIEDPSGATYKTSGKWGKAGDPKMITIFEERPKYIDMWEWEYQLNNYRLYIEKYGFPVSRMFIQATVRDGNTVVAAGRGIAEEIYKIPVKRIDDEIIQRYFADKAMKLHYALQNNELPPPCNKWESWEGRRCALCDLGEFCDEAKKLKNNKKEEENGKQ